MATFKTIDCHTGEASFFSEMQYDSSSYSCSWATKFVPDTDVGDMPVYLQVLNKFNIPTAAGSLPPGGTLPGMDINRMSAIEAINLSLAEALTVGQWWEVYEDGEGGVYFQNVYQELTPAKIIRLDVRMCIPTTAKTNDVDMVVVTGYDPPPCRYAGTFKDVVPAGTGPVNPITVPSTGVFTVDESELFNTATTNTCHKFQLQHIVSKSYPDPLIDATEFQGQVVNPFFDPKAYEKLVTWVIKVTGMPLSHADAAKVGYSFNPDTSWMYHLEGNVPFSKVADNTQAVFACGDLYTDSSIVYYESKFTVNNQNFTDKYGDQWPLIVRPSNILYMGYKINSIIAFPTGNGNQSSYMFVEPIPELIKMGEGSEWVYELDDSGNFNFTLFYQPKKDEATWEAVLAATTGGSTVSIKIDDHSGSQNIASATDLPTASPAKGVVSSSAGLGYLIMDMWIDFRIDRPSVTVTTADGSPARPHSDALRVQYAPIVVFDPPAEMAYKHKDFGLVKLDLDALALSEADSDPTTCQNFESTPKVLMQDRMEGNVINVTLPFCQDADACAKVAETIFDYQNYGLVNTYTLTCGPSDEPELGAAIDGYDTNLRVESINYSYSDGSAYTIEVALAPVFSNVGSWNTGSFGGTYQDVDRAAIVVWSGGDGVNYRVDVQGLGEYNAINNQREVWRVGERVTVKLKNVPVERV